MPDASSGKTILIAGPTASGKSAVAFALAIERSAEIVNADALQVYRDLKVLSARPSDEERARIPHHLFGHVDAVRRYSVGEWLRAAKEIVADITGRGATRLLSAAPVFIFARWKKGSPKFLISTPIPNAKRQQGLTRSVLKHSERKFSASIRRWRNSTRMIASDICALSKFIKRLACVCPIGKCKMLRRRSHRSTRGS